jgi:hypothetical protein
MGEVLSSWERQVVWFVLYSGDVWEKRTGRCSWIVKHMEGFLQWWEEKQDRKSRGLAVVPSLKLEAQVSFLLPLFSIISQL